LNNGIPEFIINTMQKETSPRPVRARNMRLFRHPDALSMGAIFILSLSFHITACAITVTFSDSGDFLMALSTVGNVHGPGYPLYVSTCKLFTLVFPFGSLAFRASVYSAIFAALTAVLLYWIIVRMTRSRAGGAIAALIYSFSFTYFYQTVIPETYALDTFLIASLIILALRWERQVTHGEKGRAVNTLCAFALVFGLAMANHFTVIFLLPAFIFLALDTNWREALSLKNLVRVAAFFVIGLLPYLYEPAAAFRGPAYNYGDPSTLTRWFQLVSVHYQQSGLFAYPMAYYPARFWRYFGTLNTEFPYFAWLGGFGFIASFLRRKNKHAIFLLALFLLSLLPVMGYGQSESVLRAHFYYPSYMLFSIWIGIGAATLVQLTRRALKRRDLVVKSVAVFVIVILLLLSPLLALVIHYRKVDKSSYEYARQMAVRMLSEAEPDSVILVDSDNLYFPPQYMQVVEHFRPDVRVVIVTSIGAPGFHGLDLLASPTQSGPSLAGFERFSQIVQNNIVTVPTYSANPFFLTSSFDAVWLGHLIRYYPRGTGEKAASVTPSIKVKGSYSDLDSDGRQAVLAPDTLQAAVQSSAGDQKAASSTYRKAILAFQRDMYVPTLYSCADFAQLYSYWGNIMTRLGQETQVTKYLPMAREIEPNAYYTSLARAYLDTGNTTAAVKELKGVLAFQGLNALAFQLLGEAYYKEGKDSQAVAELDKAIKADPNDPISHFLKAESLVVLKRLSEAKSEYNAVIKLNPSGPLGEAARKKLTAINQ